MEVAGESVRTIRTGPATEMDSSSSSCPVSRGSPPPPGVKMRNVFVLTQVLFLGVEGEPPPVYGSDVSFGDKCSKTQQPTILAVLLVCESSAVSRYVENNGSCV